MTHGLSGNTCSTACGILVPQPGMEPVSSALQGRFLTTGPPRKSQSLDLSVLFERWSLQSQKNSSVLLPSSNPLPINFFFLSQLLTPFLSPCLQIENLNRRKKLPQERSNPLGALPSEGYPASLPGSRSCHGISILRSLVKWDSVG